VTRALVLAVAAALLVPLSFAILARAQTSDTRNRALIVLDASKSMNEDAHDGGTRLDAAKRAVGELLDHLPPGVPLGLRVYGSKVDEASRAEACRDTELTVPVGPLDRARMRSTVNALQGRGRTPIGTSLLAAPDDLGSAAGRRSVVLVSDGGDNCAPPDPCKAAARVAGQGVDLSISVVGLQVNERVRRQLECIARAGGGSYVDVQDAGKLGDELAAALARAFRSYEPAGTKVTGATSESAAAASVLGPGEFQDVTKPGDERWYTVDVPAGRRLMASVTAIPSKEAAGQSALATELIDPSGRTVDSDSQVMYGKDAGQAGRVRSQGLKTPGFAPGRYRIHVKVEDEGMDPLPIPIELGVQLLKPGEPPGLVREPGTLAVATPRPRATVTATSSARDSGGGVAWAFVIIVAAVGLMVGLAAAMLGGRRAR
jgi:Ca-activated chloride channel family protein